MDQSSVGLSEQVSLQLWSKPSNTSLSFDSLRESVLFDRSSYRKSCTSHVPLALLGSCGRGRNMVRPLGSMKVMEVG